VVNVLLLDSLNTPMEDQSFVHTQAMKFLKSMRPGSRMAIFTMSFGLRFVQDSPTTRGAGGGLAARKAMRSRFRAHQVAEDANAQATVLAKCGNHAGRSRRTTTVATRP